MMRLTSLVAVVLLSACGPEAAPWGEGVPRAVASTRGDLLQARATAERDGTTFFIQYDTLGAAQDTWAEQLEQDWREVMHVTQSPAYAREHGRPVVVLDGFGFADRPGTVAQAMDVVDWLKAQGCLVVGRVPRGWRTGEGTSPNFLAAFLRLDAVLVSGATNAEALADAAWATERGVAYVPAGSVDWRASR